MFQKSSHQGDRGSVPGCGGGNVDVITHSGAQISNHVFVSPLSFNVKFSTLLLVNMIFLKVHFQRNLQISRN